MLVTEPIYPVPGIALTALIEKKIMLVQGLCYWAIGFDVVQEQLYSLGPESYLPITVAFSQDGQRCVFRVEVIQMQASHLLCPGSGVVEQMQDHVVSEPSGSFEIDGGKDLHDFIVAQVAKERLLEPFLGKSKNLLGQFGMFRVEKTDHFGQGFEDSQSVPPGSGRIVPLSFKVIQKIKDESGTQVLNLQGSYVHIELLGCIGKKQVEGLPVSRDGVWAGPFDSRQVVIKVPVQTIAKLHNSS